MEKIIIKSEDFKLYDTFECGQCFRWEEEEDGAFVGIAGGRCARLRETKEGIVIETTKEDYESFWVRYFDLERDYGSIKKSLCINDIMREAVNYGGGIRILRQEFFETLVSFIISQRSSIPKIKSTIKKMCERYGEKITFFDKEYYAFPESRVIAALSEEELRSLGVGYRAPYIMRAAYDVESGRISEQELLSLPTDEARKKLISMYGVGDKVCDCVLLFSLAKYDLFPSDVWIKRVMAEEFGAKENDAKKEGEALFGAYSGFAQQYLFYYRRNGR